MISAAINVPVFDSYRLREAGLVGHECVYATMHTVDEQLLLQMTDLHTLEPTDEERKLVVTNIYSSVMPMILYRTGDIVTLSTEPCPCGLSLNRINISRGRIADFVVTSDGRWLPGYVFIYICRSVPGIVKFQMTQGQTEDLVVLLEVDQHFPADGVERVRQQTRKRLNCPMRVDVRMVDDIRAAASGKHRPEIGKVAEARLREARLARHQIRATV